jgi:uncharacterized membrane protein
MVALAYRPESWNWLLFVHILAAMSMFGGVFLSTVVGIAAARRDSVREIFLLARVGYRSDLFVTTPAFIVLFVAGMVLAGREKVFDQAWVQAGIALSVIGPLLAGLFLSWLNLRVMRRGEQLLAEGVERSEELRRMANNLLYRILGPPLLAAFVALFALMTAKP